MARRNPQNPRYQKDQLGKTRKSASSAKPKRSAGAKGSGSTSKKASSGPRPKGWRGFFQPLPTPDTKRFKMWRRIWAGFFVAGVIFTLLALLQWETGIGTGLLVAAYTCLFSAIFIDIVKIRRMRREYADELEGITSDKKPSQSGKAGDEKSSSKKSSPKGDE